MLARGAKVRAHDPIALDNARRQYADSGIEFCASPAPLATNADALVLATEWQEYSTLPWPSLAKSMRHPIMLDGRNFLDRKLLEASGFRYLGMGV